MVVGESAVAAALPRGGGRKRRDGGVCPDGERGASARGGLSAAFGKDRREAHRRGLFSFGPYPKLASTPSKPCGRVGGGARSVSVRMGHGCAVREPAA